MERADGLEASEGERLSGNSKVPVAAPAAEDRRRVFQEADQTLPQCSLRWFLHVDAPHQAK